MPTQTTTVRIPSRFNIDRINHAIALMEKVVARQLKFDLSWWYGNMCSVTDKVCEQSDRNRVTEQVIVECGTSACLFGWIATTPEFYAEGGSYVDADIIFGDMTNVGNGVSYRSAHNWFGTRDACLLVLPDDTDIEELDPESIEAVMVAYAADQNIERCKLESFCYDVYGYGYPAGAPTAQEVLDRLTEIRDTGMVTVHVNQY